MAKQESLNSAKIIDLREEISRIRREEAEARDQLVKQGLIEPGQELKLPATLVLALATRKKMVY